jgi:2',3'-cyclic-nucleotide 2'-phosphodiesterase (5'-nucleotidase family)
MKPYVSTINASLANNMTPDPIVDTLLDKYKNEIAKADEVLGTLPSGLNSTVLRNLVASLYLEAGMERWGDDYDIVLGGGFLSVSNPYDLDAGEVKYRDLQSIFPFDNEIVLCSVSGKKLLSQFINTDNSNYFVAMSTYGKNITIDPSKTYYIVVDTYTSTYNYNGLTEVARYDSGVYARDLLADYIKKNYN